MNIRDLYRFKRYFKMAGFEPIISQEKNLDVWGTDNLSNRSTFYDPYKAYEVCYTLADHFMLPDKIRKLAKRYLRHHKHTKDPATYDTRYLSYNEFYRMKEIFERAGVSVTVKYLPVPALTIGKHTHISTVSAAMAYFSVYKQQGRLPPWLQFIPDED